MNTLDTIVGALAFFARWLIYSAMLYAVWRGSRTALVVTLGAFFVKDELHVLVTRARKRHTERIATRLATKQRGPSVTMLRKRG